MSAGDLSGATVRTIPLDDDRPLIDLVPDGVVPTTWIVDGHGLVGWGEAARIDPGSGAGRFERAEEQLQALIARTEVDDTVGLPGTGAVAFGSFTFDDVPGSRLLVPGVVVGRRGGTTWLTTVEGSSGAPVSQPRSDAVVPAPRDRPRYAGTSLPDVRWLEAVAAAIALIEAGELEKVVLARDHRLWSRTPFDVCDLARRLSARFPGCWTFVVDGLVGSTPELLVSRSGQRVTSRVLAGTTGRDPDPDRDEELGRRLLASSKDRLEHRLAAESVREVLARHCTQLRHDPEPKLLLLDYVQHLATVFHGRLDAPRSSLALAGELHPTAAVGGTPREGARQVIRELEHLDRGRYAAPVGWIDADGDGEWGIALRCAEIDGARARLFAGVGIVPGSLPESELAETRIKLLAMQATMGADPTAGH